MYRNMCENMRPEAQVFVSCNFCGKSVGYSTLASRNRRMFSSTLALKSKVRLWGAAKSGQEVGRGPQKLFTVSPLVPVLCNCHIVRC